MGNDNNKKSSVLSKIRNILILVVVSFVLYNAVLFFYIVQRASKESINPEARMYLRSAVAINSIYILPLAKSFGWDSPITLPFYSVRNYLYNKGLKCPQKSRQKR